MSEMQIKLLEESRNSVRDNYIHTLETIIKLKKEGHIDLESMQEILTEIGVYHIASLMHEERLNNIIIQLAKGDK